jgi:hypothetical protein
MRLSCDASTEGFPVPRLPFPEFVGREPHSSNLNTEFYMLASTSASSVVTSLGRALLTWANPAIGKSCRGYAVSVEVTGNVQDAIRSLGRKLKESGLPEEIRKVESAVSGALGSLG